LPLKIGTFRGVEVLFLGLSSIIVGRYLPPRR